MSLQEVLPEQLAELFHHYHQALGPDFACGTTADPEPWDQVTAQEKKRMIAAARLALRTRRNGTWTRRFAAILFKARRSRVGLLIEDFAWIGIPK